MTRILKLKEAAKMGFAKPSVVSFMGLPGCGKSTIARLLADHLNCKVYLENEEHDYPETVLAAFQHREAQNSALCIYNHFRNQRMCNNFLAQIDKIKGLSSVIDSYYDKFFGRMIGLPAMNFLINSKHVDFPEIVKIAKRDKVLTPDPDIIFFLRVRSQQEYIELLKSRGRKTEVPSKIFDMQNDPFS